MTTTTATESAPAALLDRDLSWLEFNRRVLHEALDPRTPLLERIWPIAPSSSRPSATRAAACASERAA